MREGHITKLEQIGENVFVSPAVVAITIDGSVKIAMDAVRLNKQKVKKTSQMPNCSELLDQVSIKITTDQDDEPRGTTDLTVVFMDWQVCQSYFKRKSTKH